MPNIQHRSAQQPAIHPLPDGAIVLSKIIAAIQITANEEGKVRPGLITQLPKGAELQVCGEGFTERSVKVRCGEAFYYVFSQDLEEPEPYRA